MIHAPKVSLLLLRQAIKPFLGGRVVMGAGINHRVVDVVAREIGIIGVTVECKLKNPCPGNSELIAQPRDIRSN